MYAVSSIEYLRQLRTVHPSTCHDAGFSQGYFHRKKIVIDFVSQHKVDHSRHISLTN